MKNELKKRTQPLNNYEQNVLLPILMKGLKMKRGMMNAVTNKQIIHGLRAHGLRTNEKNLCKLINYIRINDLVAGLMASSTGYYIASNEQELIKYENSLLNREVKIRKVRMSIKRQRRAMFSKLSYKQTQLF